MRVTDVWHSRPRLCSPDDANEGTAGGGCATSRCLGTKLPHRKRHYYVHESGDGVIFVRTGDDRFVTYLWPHVSLVHDVDDTREARYGVYYSKKKPLTGAALKKSEGIG